MQYLFNVARGKGEESPEETRKHLDRVCRALFTPAGLTQPVIPDMFWETPLGIACLVAEKGVEAVYPILYKLEADD